MTKNKKDTWLVTNRVVRVSLAVCVFLFYAMKVHAAEISADTEETDDGNTVQIIRDVQMFLSTDESPPADDAAWQPFVLPYQLPLDVVEQPYAWFRFDVSRSNSKEPFSLYINNHMFGVQVWMNGEWIGGSLAPEDREAMGWNLPLLVNIPQSSWRSAGNELHVRLALARYTNALTTVMVGPEQQLRPLWQQRQFWQGQVSLFSFLLCLLMGAFMLGLWAFRRQDTQYLLFGCSSLCWSIPMLYMTVPYAPIPHSLFLILTFWAVNAYGVISLRFLHRLMAYNFPRLERWHWQSVALVCAAIPFASATYVMGFALVADTLSLLMLIHFFVICARQALRPGEYKARLVVAMGLAVMLIFTRDIYEFQSSARSNTMVSSGTYMQYAFPIVMLVLFVILMKRFVTALQQSEQLNRELEQRVAAIDARLQASYAANRAYELKQATEQQKQKIYRDLHDDVGARLVSIMHARASDEQSRMAQQALASLRETVSSGNFQDENLADLLTDASHNIESRCSNSDLSFMAPDLREVPTVIFSGNRCYHLKRILQEVVSNIIKHAGATMVTMTAQNADGMLEIHLQDDGRGLSPSQNAGNGMINIRYRAKEIHATADWYNLTEGGCNFVLRLDLNAES